MAPDGGMERWTQEVEGREVQSCDALLETGFPDLTWLGLVLGCRPSWPMRH